MNPARLVDDRLKPKGVTLSLRIGGRLDGWRLAFDKVARSPTGAGAGNIVVAPGEVVHGTLNEMPPAGLDVLDVWEGVATGHYERRTVRVVGSRDPVGRHAVLQPDDLSGHPHVGVGLVGAVGEIRE